MHPYETAMAWCSSAVQFIGSLLLWAALGRMQISLAVLQSNVVTAAVQTSGSVIKSEFWYAGIFVVLGSSEEPIKDVRSI